MWRERKYEHEAFGGPLEHSSRRDYIDGQFYSGRREFLHSDEHQNVLEPPDEFKTRRQVHNSMKIKNAGGIDYSKIATEFKKAKVENISKDTNTLIARRDAGKKPYKKPAPKDMMIIEKYSSTDPRDWREMVQAGVRIWVNPATGEASDECPYDHHCDEGNKALDEIEVLLGGGILSNVALDGKPLLNDDLADVFAVLESPTKSKK